MQFPTTLTKYHPLTKNSKRCQEGGWNIKINNRQGCKWAFSLEFLNTFTSGEV